MIRIPTIATNAKIVLQESYDDNWSCESPEIFRDKVSRALGWMNNAFLLEFCQQYLICYLFIQLPKL